MSTYTVVALVVLPITGGFIAWAGDVIGYRVGKRRGSLFGLRPRTTARIIGVAVGIILPLGGLAVAAGGSEYVRIALFHLESLTQRNEELVGEVAKTEAKLAHTRQQAQQATEKADWLTGKVAQGEQQLKHMQSRLGDAQQRLRQASNQLSALKTQTSQLRAERDELIKTREKLKSDLANLENEHAGLEAEYSKLQSQYATTTSQLKQAKVDLDSGQEKIATLQTRETTLNSRLVTLEGHISTLEGRIAERGRQLEEVQDELQDKKAQLLSVQRELLGWQLGAKGPVAYEPGDEIIRAVIETHQTHQQIESSLVEVLVWASKAAQGQGVRPGESSPAVRLLGPVPAGKAPGHVSHARIVKAVARQIWQSAESSCVVSVKVLARAFKRQPEPAWVMLWSTPNRCVFRRDETIVSVQIDGGAPRAAVYRDLMRLLGRLRQTAQEKGVLPVPGTGQYGEVPAEEVLAMLDKLLETGQSRPVYALSAENVYVANEQPFLVTLKVGGPSESGSS